MSKSVLEMTIPGKLKAKQRARTTKTGHTYTPRDTVVAEAYIREHFSNHFPAHKPLEGPVSIEIEVYRVPPQSWAKWRREAALNGTYLDAMGADLDNKVKTVMDALNRVAFIDDSQVIHVTARKCFDAFDHVYVRIEEHPQATKPVSNVTKANKITQEQYFQRKALERKHPAIKRSGGVYGS